MKTYYVMKYPSRVAAYLIAVCYPFHFDGSEIEFTASDKFIERMKSEDAKLEEILNESKWK